MPKIILTQDGLSGYLFNKDRDRSKTPSWEDYLKFQKQPTSVLLDNLYDTICDIAPSAIFISLEDDVSGDEFDRILYVGTTPIFTHQSLIITGNEDKIEASVWDLGGPTWYIDDPESYDKIISWYQLTINEWSNIGSYYETQTNSEKTNQI